MRDNSTMEVLSRAENKGEENLFTINDKEMTVTNERNSRKCKRSNIEKIQLNSTSIVSIELKKVVRLKIMLAILISSLNLNFSNIIY